MILVDSTVLIDYFRKKDKKLLAVMKARGGAVCGIVRAEILHGFAVQALLGSALPSFVWYD